MKFKLSAYTIYELGQRKRQEDSIFPQHNATQADDRLFIVCDGMGGHSGGNIASAAVCEAMSNKLLTLCPDAEGRFSDDDLRQALEAAYDLLDTKDDGSEKKMGTTMTLLKFHDAGCTIAHIGDSRVYHVRPGADSASTQILFQTQDHSLVNDLVRIGELTPEEAKTSKQRNIITRAMQPNMGRRSRADIYHTTDIRPGDYFMLCTDGILEQMEDDNIKYIFSDKVGDAQQKVDMIVKVTEDNSDNHSAILVKVTDVKGAPVFAAADVDLHQTAESVEEKHNEKSRRTQLIYLLGMLAIVIGTILFLVFYSSDDDVPEGGDGDVTNVVKDADGSITDALLDNATEDDSESVDPVRKEVDTNETLSSVDTLSNSQLYDSVIDNQNVADTSAPQYTETQIEETKVLVDHGHEPVDESLVNQGANSDVVVASVTDELEVQPSDMDPTSSEGSLN